MSRTIRLRFTISAILWLGVLGLALRPPADRVAAQEPPTKAPIEVPTKPPVDPGPEPATKDPIKPTAVPPLKPTATSLPTKEPWTSTPVATELATLSATKTPIGLLPTKPPLPTNSPTPQSGSSDRSPTPVGGDATSDQAVPTGPVEVVATVAAQMMGPTPSAPLLIGMVFEDLNANGVQDVDERGLSGVAVVIETAGHAQTLLTDASGAYAAQSDPNAAARVIPPAGWLTDQIGSLPLDRARSFPLRQPAVMLAAPTVTSSVINFTSLALGFLGLGAIVWLGLLQHQRAHVASFNAWARADLRLRSEAERLARREHLTIDETWIVRVLNQVGLDVTGEHPGIDQVERLVLDPLPAIVGLGQGFQRFVFTPIPDVQVRRLVKRKALTNLIGDSWRDVRVLPIDALHSDLFVTDDLTLAFQLLCGRWQLPALPQTTLPRTERWTLYVVAQQRGKVAK